MIDNGHGAVPQQPAAMPDIYPMPSFVTLAVSNVSSSLAWYRDVLGFQIVMAFGASSSTMNFAHLRWTKFGDLLLRAGNRGPGEGITISYQVELEKIDSLAERARASGVGFVAELGNRPWNTREFTIADPDGYQISFTAGPVNKSLNVADITTRLRSSASA